MLSLEGILRCSMYIVNILYFGTWHYCIRVKGCSDNRYILPINIKGTRKIWFVNKYRRNILSILFTDETQWCWESRNIDNVIDRPRIPLYPSWSIFYLFSHAKKNRWKENGIDWFPANRSPKENNNVILNTRTVTPNIYFVLWLYLFKKSDISLMEEHYETMTIFWKIVHWKETISNIRFFEIINTCKGNAWANISVCRYRQQFLIQLSWYFLKTLNVQSDFCKSRIAWEIQCHDAKVFVSNVFSLEKN